MNKNYEDIISMQHHISVRHPHMSMIDRAAQFSPFAALSGHSEAVNETARLTDSRVELDENVKVILDEKLAILQEKIKSNPLIVITHFEKDIQKSGGRYISTQGIIRKIDTYERRIILQDGTIILIDDIYDISGEVFSFMEFENS